VVCEGTVAQFVRAAEDGVMKVLLARRKVLVAVDIASFLLQRKAHLVRAHGASRKYLTLEQGSFVGFAMAVMLDPVDP
jgi:hypothetical protein